MKRGDAPAQAVLHANSQAMSLRKAAETQEELGKINDRVEKTLDSYILADSIEQPITGKDIAVIKDKYVKDKTATLELVDDLTQLIIILSDPIAKKKYQQQVTIFIVGYENLCGNRVKLLTQLNDFFLQNSKEEDAYDIEYPEFDIEEVGKTVRAVLDKAEKAHERLNDVSKEVVKVLETVNPKEAKSRKKKLEKAIIQSRDDIIQLTEKLTSIQKDLENSEEKLAKLYKTLEGKQLEIEKLKGHVEMGKRKAKELDDLRSEMEQKSAALVKTRQDVDKLKLQLAHAEDKHENVSNKQKESREKQQRMQSDLEDRIKEQKDKVVEIRQAMEKQHDQELRDLRNSYQTELDETRGNYQEKIDDLTTQIALIEKQRDDAEQERAELQRFTTSFFNDETERSRSATKMSWKTSANAVRIASTKKSQRSLGTDSIPNTPGRALKTDGTIASLKSNKSSDNLRPALSQSDRSNTETTFPSMIPENALEQTSVSFVQSSADGTPSTGGMPSSPEKSMPSRGKKRTVKSRTMLSRTSSKQALTKVDSGRVFIEMVDEAIQTEIVIPEKPAEDSEAAASLRKLSVVMIPETLVKELSDIDENTNWDEYPIQEIPARFAHYRQMAVKKEEEMLEELGELKQKYNNKVQALKGMMDLRNNWTMEREEFIRQITTAKALKEEAENEAEMALLQVEELIADQEEMRLEIQMKTKALSEIPTMPSPLQTAASMHEIGIGTEDRSSENEGMSTMEIASSRPTTIPTIIQTDDVKSEVILSHEPEVLTIQDRLPERIMSAKARTRLVNSALTRHPVAKETLLNYRNILDFKRSIVDVLAKEELEYEASMLNECEIIKIDEDNKLAVLERISDIRRSTSGILECLSDIIPSLLSAEDILFSNLDNPRSSGVSESQKIATLENDKQIQEPPGTPSTSSKTEATERPQEEVDSDTKNEVQGQESKAGLDLSAGKPEGSIQAESSNNTLTEPGKSASLLSSDDSTRRGKKLSAKEGRKKLVSDYKELIAKHQQLTEEFENLTRDSKQTSASYEGQLTQNATIMQDMQSTIENLTEQLKSFDITHPLTVKSSQIKSPDFMFTRLDMEHNAKALKRGLQNGRISYEGYKEMCNKMEDYISIPIKRLARLARKYLHHSRMKEVEKSIRSSNMLDDKVYHLLDQMENLQYERTLRWEQRMHDLAGERQEVAKLLVKTLEMIEHETGIFLIKPIMSIPSRKRRIGSGHIVSRRVKSAKDEVSRQQSSGFLAPNSTPSPSGHKQNDVSPSVSSIRISRRLDDKVLQMNVKSMLGHEDGFENVWKAQSSVSGPLPISKSFQDMPKIVELDLNRSMFAHHNISARLNSNGEFHTGPVHSNMLSYVTVARPAGELSKRSSMQFEQSTVLENDSLPPPPSPFDENVQLYQLKKRQSPLPPIHSSHGEYEDGRSVSTYLSDGDRHWSPVLAQLNEAK